MDPRRLFLVLHSVFLGAGAQPPEPVPPLNRPALSMWAYSASERALNYLQAPESSTNSSWIDFFLGTGMICFSKNESSGHHGGLPPHVCSPDEALDEVARAVSVLEVPALWPAAGIFFRENGEGDSLEEIMQRWSQFKDKLKETVSSDEDILGFILADEVGRKGAAVRGGARRCSACPV